MGEIRKSQKGHLKDRIHWSEFKKLFTKKRIKNFIKSPRVAAPILAYLILLGPILYLYSGSPPETEVQVYKGAWLGFSIPYFQPLAFDTARMKDDGMDTVFLAYTYFCFKSDGSLLYDIPLQRELVVAHIQTAHRDGLKVALTLFIPPPLWPEAADLDLEDFNSKVIELAKLAEKYGVEFFAPFSKPDCIFLENSAGWGQEILPRVREVYHGEVIWKGAIHCYIDEMLSGEFPTDFSGYDYIGFSITPPAGMTLEEYPQFVDNVLDAVLGFAERDNVKGVMVTEFGVWEGGPWSEEEVARAHEIVLERGKDNVVGFFAVDHPLGMAPTVSGKTEEVIRRWYSEIL